MILTFVAIGFLLLLGHYTLKHLTRQQSRAALPPPRHVSLAVFHTLSQDMQLAVVQQEGTFLTRRWESDVEITLYHLRGHFFCELHQQPATQQLLRVHTFTDSALLERYTQTISLDHLLALAIPLAILGATP